MNKKDFEKSGFLENRKGSALFLTLMILSGMMVVALGVTNFIITGVKIGGVQSRSTKAYFASESGTEKALWKYKKNPSNFASSTREDFLTKTLSNGSSYKVDYRFKEVGAKWEYKKFISVGSFENTRRTVETTLRFPQD